MNRQHTGDDYRRLVDRIRAARPDIALFVGFHCRLSRRKRRGFRGHAAGWCAMSSYAHCFLLQIFSTRPGTPAAAMRKQVAGRCEGCAAGGAAEAAAGAAGHGQSTPADRQDPAGAVRESRAAGRARSWAARPIFSRCMSTAAAGLIGQVRECGDRRRCTANSLHGRAGLNASAKSDRAKRATHAGISPTTSCWPRCGGPHARNISPGWSSGSMSASPSAAIWWRIDGTDARARRARFCARFMPGWKRAKASPWPKWMPRSASPIGGARRSAGRDPHRSARASPARAARAEPPIWI